MFRQASFLLRTKAKKTFFYSFWFFLMNIILQKISFIAKDVEYFLKNFRKKIASSEKCRTFAALN